MFMNSFLGILSVFLFSFSVSAEQSFNCTHKLEAQGDLLGLVDSSYKNISTIRADFHQTSYFAGLDRSESSSGSLEMKRPGMMNWSYAEPHKQSFVADGDSLWFYQPEDNQVTIGRFQQSFSSELPVSFLIGIGKLSESFDLANVCGTEKGIKLDLKSKKPDPSMQGFSLLVDKSNYTPLGANITDVGGNQTSIILADLKFNSEIQDESFNFKIPRGVDIIDRR